MQGRNRRCITVDMRQEEGRQIIKQLANKVDVLVENFRPGVMEKWNLGPKANLRLSPDPAYAASNAAFAVGINLSCLLVYGMQHAAK